MSFKVLERETPESQGQSTKVWAPEAYSGNLGTRNLSWRPKFVTSFDFWLCFGGFWPVLTLFSDSWGDSASNAPVPAQKLCQFDRNRLSPIRRPFCFVDGHPQDVKFAPRVVGAYSSVAEAGLVEGVIAHSGCSFPAGQICKSLTDPPKRSRRTLGSDFPDHGRK